MYEAVADNVALQYFAVNNETGDVTLIKDLRDDPYMSLSYQVRINYKLLLKLAKTLYIKTSNLQF